MSDDAYDLADLHEKAAARRVVVVGAGIGGLVAAREIARLGIGVTLIERSDRVGGAIRSADVAGLALDLGAESYATRGGHIDRLIEDLGLAGDVVDPGTGAGGAWVAGVPGIGAAPLPTGGVLGIPVTPFADDVRRVLGWGGAWRAYLDRIRPVLRIGHAHSLGDLVTSRMGRKVHDRLVAPVTTGVYSASPANIDPDVAAPGLNEAVTRAGSLSGGVGALVAERRTAPGGAVRGIRGGMGRIVGALVADIEERGGEVRTGTAVRAIEPGEPDEVGGEPAQGWRVIVERPDTDDAEETDTVEDDALAADAVIVATEESAARRLGAPVVAELSADPPEPGPAVTVVTLVVASAALDARPRGTGVLTVPGSHRAKALTHTTAKWQWVADQADPGVHAVRVSFGSSAEAPATDGLSGDDAAELALAEASQLLGVPLELSQLRGFRVERFAQSQPASTIGQAGRTRSVRSVIRAVPTIGAVGAWLAGTGLAQVVPDAIAEADRIRRAVLFEARRP